MAALLLCKLSGVRWFGREEAARYFQSFLGAHRMCVLEHLQFGVVHDENAILGNQRRFPVVILPDVAVVSAEETVRPDPSRVSTPL